MISIEEVVKRINKKKLDYSLLANKSKKYEEPWKPMRCNDYVLPEFKVETPSTAKGAKTKWVTKLSKIYAFIKNVQYKRLKTGCTIMPISTTSKKNLGIWGTDSSVNNALRYMEEIGLISVHSTYTRFGTKNCNSSYTYKYYKENEDKFIELCKENNIKPYVVLNDLSSVVAKYKDISDFDKEKICFKSKLKLTRPDEIGISEFEKYVIKTLYENYSNLSYYQKIADEINKNYYKDYPELRISFVPNIHWSDSNKTITGIGIRASNSLVTVKKEDRKKVLDKYGFNKEKDIKSSVPRLTLALNKGHWIDESIDLYKLVFDEMEPNGDFNNDVREAIKSMHMKSYFDSSVANTVHHVWMSMDQSELIRKDVENVMKKYYEAIRVAEGGKSYGNYIFYVESCVYLRALKYIFDMGHEVWLLYDAFYAKGASWIKQDEFEKVVRAVVRISFIDFMVRAIYGKDVSLDISGTRVRDDNVKKIEEAVYGINNKIALEVIIYCLTFMESKRKRLCRDDKEVHEYYEDFQAIMDSIIAVNDLREVQEALLAVILYNCKSEGYDVILDIINICNKEETEDIIRGKDEFFKKYMDNIIKDSK